MRRAILIGSIIGLAALIVWVGFSRSEDPDLVAKRAIKAVAEKRIDLARVELERLAQLRSPTTEDWILRGEVAREAGEDNEAIEALGHVPEGHAAYLPSRLTMGLLLLKSHQASKARESLVEVIRKGSLSRVGADASLVAQARRAVLKIDLLYGDQDLVDRGLRALSASEQSGLTFDEAFLWTVGRPRDIAAAEMAETLERWIQAEPGNERARLGLTEALRSLGKLEEAEAVLEESPSRDSMAWRLVHAKVAFDRGQTDVARSELSMTPSEGSRLPNDARISQGEAERAVLLGRIELAAGNLIPAINSFRSALGGVGTDREARFGLAQALRLSGKNEEARKLLDQVAQRDQLERRVRQAQIPSEQADPQVLFAIGEACERADQPERARAWYRLALAKDPTRSSWQAALGRVDRLSRVSSQNAPDVF